MTTISAIARTTATAIVPQNITLGRASTSAPIHSISSAGVRWCSGCSAGVLSPGVVVTACSLVAGRSAVRTPRTKSPVGPYQESGTDADERQAVDLDSGANPCR